MAAWTVVSRGFGFARVLVIAAVLGTTFLGNAFQGANSFSNIIFELLAAGALSAVLVPSFVRMLSKDRSADAQRQAGELLGVSLVVLGVLAVVGVLAAPLIAELLTASIADREVAASQADLMTFLLRFFVPQIVLYGWGAVAIVVLHAQRRFSITAAAPIANTVVVVALLVVFSRLAQGSTSLSIGTGERLTLAAAGTVGVLGYVGVLVVALERTGFRLRPRWSARAGNEIKELLRHSAWGVLLHTTAGALLGVAVVVGAGVEGGVVAYQVAFVFFLAPYAVLAQPIHTTVLPELVETGLDADSARFADRFSWALESMTRLLVPVTVAAVVFARPLMEIVTFGNAAPRGPVLIAAAFAALATGLLPYSVFLLAARGCYALGDSRAPAAVAVVATCIGVATMLIAASVTDGTATLVAIGLGHTVSYLVGAGALAVVLHRVAGLRVVPTGLVRTMSTALAVGAVAWAAMVAIAPSGRSESVVALLTLGVPSAALYTLASRHLSAGHPSARAVAP